MYHTMMRPSEVAALTEDACHLPETGWGHLTLADASPAAGKAFSDDGQVHEHRCLKGRNKGCPNTTSRGRRPTRRVPIPPRTGRPAPRAHQAALRTTRWPAVPQRAREAAPAI